MSTVLVTGGSGFVGSHVVLQLLNAGHDVRTTVRSLTREAAVRAMLTDAGAVPDAPLSFRAADLERDEGWQEAVSGCDYVIHVASPMPAAAPKTEDELIRPARDGVLRVLRAARDAGVKRVVLTSSCGAVYYGHPPQAAPFDETSWTNTDGEMSAYVRSKAIAERAAWDFMSAEGRLAGALGHQSGRHLRTDTRRGFLVVHRSGDSAAEGHARVSASLLRRRRRARCRGPAHSRDDAPRCSRREIHRHVGRHHVDARDCRGAPRTPGRRRRRESRRESFPAGSSAWWRGSIAI